MKTLLLIAAYLFTSIIIAMSFVGFAKADDIVSATYLHGTCQALEGMAKLATEANNEGGKQMVAAYISEWAARSHTTADRMLATCAEAERQVNAHMSETKN